MARKSRQRKTRKHVSAVPAEKLMGPTPEQSAHADYHRDEIIHAETFTRVTVHRIRQQSSLRKLLDDGQITDDQFFAAGAIAYVAEMIERNVAVSCASLEARVDCAGSGRHLLIERLGAVRMETVYTQWRTSIAIPRRMIVDMVLEDRALFATARVYRVGWPRAKRLLKDALDLWNELMDRAYKEITQEDLDEAQARACA